ncbi:MAG: 5'-methylthioadenosine/adenosylhomocysteine nucleosidase [Spirochaetaceae bacterium]|jgi:adenosylhomocysteine nucleosidase|nr:5'-methylthioadenosine/adenosylhomocysteine nucleosidase [Spirochaetaceae bacterium]
MAEECFGIIGAMHVEVDLLKKALAVSEKQTIAGLEFFSGVLGGISFVVVQSGIGKVNAALCAQILIDRFRVNRIINTGIAGAIAEDLKPLDMVLSTELVYHDVDVSGLGYAPTMIPGMAPSIFTADPGLLAAAKTAAQARGDNFRCYSGRIATGDQFIASLERKEAIRKTCAPLCTEMEGAAIAHVASVNRVPFLIIRCISDNADETVGTHYQFNEKAAADLCAYIVVTLLHRAGK